MAVLARLPGSEETTAFVFDVGTGKELHRLTVGKELGYALAVSGDTVAFVAPKSLQAWNTANGKKVFRRELPVGMSMPRVGFTPDGKTLLAGTSEGVQQLDPATGQERGPVVADLRNIGPMVATRDGRTLAAVAMNHCRIGLYDLATGQEKLAQSAGHRTGIAMVHVLGDGRYILTAAGFPQPVIKVWDAFNGQERTLFTAEPNGSAWVTGTTPGGTTALVRQTEAFVAVDVVSGAIVGRHPLSRMAPAQGVLAPSGKTVVLTSHNDPTIQVLDFPSLEQRTVLKNPEPLSYIMPAFSADGQTLLVADAKGNLRLWDLASGKEQRHGIPAVKGQLMTLALSPDGKTVAASTGERWVRMWSVATGQERLAFQEPPPRDATKGYGNPMVRFSPDGDTLMAWNYQSMRLWQVSNGKPRPTPRTPTNPVYGIPTFAPDGHSFVVPDQDGHLTIYDVATGNEARVVKFPGVALGLSFSPDGRYLATGNANGTSYILRLEPRLTAARPEPAWPKPPVVAPAPARPVEDEFVPKLERAKERLEELKRATPEPTPKE